MERTVTVTGHGSAAAAPDRAVVRVSAAHRARTVAEAVAGVDRAVSVIGRVARGLAEDVPLGSTGLQVWSTETRDGTLEFEAAHQLRLRCPDLPSASALVVALAQEVGDSLRIDSVQLEVSDPGPARTAAREAAYADARHRASHLAGLAGRGLGDVVTVVEGVGAGPVQGTLALTGLEPGESSVPVSVTVTWQLA